MNEEYFSNAKKWYNTIYMSPAFERFFYALLFCFCAINFHQVYYLIPQFRKENIKMSIIAKVNSHPEGQVVKITHLNQTNNPVLNILEFFLIKYVENRESLVYEKDKGMSIMKIKNIILQNTSSRDIYKEYLMQSYSPMSNSDISYVAKGNQKFVKINKIEFISTETTLFQEIFSTITTNAIPKLANIYFSLETTDENEAQANYVAKISYVFYLNEEKSVNSIIEFYINKYEKNLDNENLKTEN